MKNQQKSITATTGDDKSKYYKIDEVGIIGIQEKKSPRSEAYYVKKMGEIFRAARKAEQKVK